MLCFQVPVWLVDTVAVVNHIVRMTLQAAIVMVYAIMLKIVVVMFHLIVSQVRWAHLCDSTIIIIMKIEYTFKIAMAITP